MVERNHRLPAREHYGRPEASQGGRWVPRSQPESSLAPPKPTRAVGPSFKERKITLLSPASGPAFSLLRYMWFWTLLALSACLAGPTTLLLSPTWGPAFSLLRYMWFWTLRDLSGCLGPSIFPTPRHVVLAFQGPVWVLRCGVGKMLRPM